MAIDNLHRALATALGLEVYKRGTTIALSKKALQAAFVLAVKGGQIVGRQALPIAARGLPPVARAVASPYVGVPLAAATGTYALQEYLEESGQQEAQNVRVAELMRFLEEDVPAAGRKTKKRIRSTYNKAVSKAMKAVKASAKGGPKGKFTNAKKTFGQVSKAVSKAKKGGKLSPKGVTGVIKRSISGMFKAKPKRRTSSTKTTYTYRN
jgi:hypothetical protein